MQRKQIPPFGLRMPDDLKEWAQKRARQEGRSVNNLIVHLLKEVKAAGAVVGAETPAAETIQQDGQEAA